MTQIQRAILDEAIQLIKDFSTDKSVIKEQGKIIRRILKELENNSK